MIAFGLNGEPAVTFGLGAGPSIDVTANRTITLDAFVSKRYISTPGVSVSLLGASFAEVVYTGARAARVRVESDLFVSMTR